MGRSIKDPPVFSLKKPYHRWKTEVEAWKTVVTINKYVEEATVGQVLALSLPCTDEEGDIRGKVMDAVGKNLANADSRAQSQSLLCRQPETL